MHFPDDQRYDRDRSASPRPPKREASYGGGRDRSASPNGRMDSRQDPCNLAIVIRVTNVSPVALHLHLVIATAVTKVHVIQAPTSSLPASTLV